MPSSSPLPDQGGGARRDGGAARTSILIPPTRSGNLLDRREQLGSTGVGRGIAIPHCRAPVIPQLRLAYGRIPAGIPYDAIDGQPVHNLFLIVAPPVEVSNLYLPVLGRLAQFAKGLDVPEKLAALTSVDDFFALLDDR